MGGLPEEVRWRPWKTLMSASFNRNLHGAFDLQAVESHRSLGPESPIGPFVDANHLRGSPVQAIYLEKRRPTDAMDVCKIVVLARWLRLSGLRTMKKHR